MRAFWGALAFGCACGLAFVLAAALVPACYDTSVKTPPCSTNPAPEGCYPFPHDRLKTTDGGPR